MVQDKDVLALLKALHTGLSANVCQWKVGKQPQVSGLSWSRVYSTMLQKRMLQVESSTSDTQSQASEACAN